MTIKQLNKIDQNLMLRYKDQLTTNYSEDFYIDRSDILIEQMNFIALNNKNFINLK